jgi:hypothetical protein
MSGLLVLVLVGLRANDNGPPERCSAGPRRRTRDETSADKAVRRVACAEEKFFGKNTMDLQWKMRANYNARPCNGERKAAGAKTMKNNGKNNAQNNENNGTSGRALTRSGGPGLSMGCADQARARKAETRIHAIAQMENACKKNRILAATGMAAGEAHTRTTRIPLLSERPARRARTGT